MLNNEKQISKLTLKIQLSNRQEEQSGIENENKRGIASIDLREDIILATSALKFLTKLITLVVVKQRRWLKNKES